MVAKYIYKCRIYTVMYNIEKNHMLNMILQYILNSTQCSETLLLCKATGNRDQRKSCSHLKCVCRVWKMPAVLRARPCSQAFGVKSCGVGSWRFVRWFECIALVECHGLKLFFFLIKYVLNLPMLKSVSAWLPYAAVSCHLGSHQLPRPSLLLEKHSSQVGGVKWC